MATAAPDRPFGQLTRYKGELARFVCYKRPEHFATPAVTLSFSSPLSAVEIEFAALLVSAGRGNIVRSSGREEVRIIGKELGHYRRGSAGGTRVPGRISGVLRDGEH